MNKKALSGVKVVECAEFVAGPYCGKLLADLGADVVKVEKPRSGDTSRKHGPFPGDIPDPEKSALFLYLNTSKRSITLNLEMTAGRGIFRHLLADADILIADQLARHFEFEQLNALNPKLIVTSITPFGRTGPHAHFKAHPLNMVHAGMLGYVTPWVSRWPEREPIQPGGFLGEYGSGLSSATATLAALYAQRMTGKGQLIDISKQEAIIAMNRVNAPQFPNTGRSDTRFENLSGLLGDIIPCKDGYIVFQINETHHWQGLVQLMGNPEWAQDPVYLDGEERGRRFRTEIRPRIVEWAKNYPREEIYHQGQAANSPFAMVNSPADVAGSDHLKSRGFFVEVEHPVAGKVRQPGAPFIMSETPWAVERPAPTMGQHNEEILCGLIGYSKEELVKLRKEGAI